MNIGRRLRELRQAQNLSQRDIENRTGLLRCYVSRVENGHSVPTLPTLEKWARALNVEMYQLFLTAGRKPQAPKVAGKPRLTAEKEELLRRFDEMTKADRRLLLSMAREMAVVGPRESDQGE
jgi:transcriptional regulator with XRE-family HTH domain